MARRGEPRSGRWLGSHAVRVAATVAADGKLPPERRRPLPELFTAAKKIDLKSSIAEPARLYGKAKSSGGHRPIWDFGLVRRAAVDMVCQMLEPHARPRGFQYDRKGIHAAIRDVKSALAGDLKFAQRIDIRDHYGSFQAEKTPCTATTSKEAGGPRGIRQGHTRGYGGWFSASSRSCHQGPPGNTTRVGAFARCRTHDHV